MHTQKSVRLLPALLLAAILLLPIYGALLFAFDNLLGSRQLLDWYLFESHPELLSRIIGDIRQSLFIAIPAVLIATLIICLCTLRSGARGLLLGSAIVLLACGGALLVVGFGWMQALLFAATPTLAAFLATWICRTKRHAY